MVSRAQRQGIERVGTRYAIEIRKVRVLQLHERGGTMVRDGSGMFATEDQYRVVSGNGHEIIDHIRCLTLSQTLVTHRSDLILNRRLPFNDSPSENFFDFFAASAVLGIPRSVGPPTISSLRSTTVFERYNLRCSRFSFPQQKLIKSLGDFFHSLPTENVVTFNRHRSHELINELINLVLPLLIYFSFSRIHSLGKANFVRFDPTLWHLRLQRP